MVEIDIKQPMISVYKTNIESYHESKILKLLGSFDTIKQIDFDFEDCDHILRIESEINMAKEVVVLLSSNGFYCEELH